MKALKHLERTESQHGYVNDLCSVILNKALYQKYYLKNNN